MEEDFRTGARRAVGALLSETLGDQAPGDEALALLMSEPHELQRARDLVAAAEVLMLLRLGPGHEAGALAAGARLSGLERRPGESYTPDHLKLTDQIRGATLRFWSSRVRGARTEATGLGSLLALASLRGGALRPGCPACGSPLLSRDGLYLELEEPDPTISLPDWTQTGPEQTLKLLEEITHRWVGGGGSLTPWSEPHCCACGFSGPLAGLLTPVHATRPDQLG